MRVLLDANVILSGLIARRADAPPAVLLQQIRRDHFVLITSEDLLDELRTVIRREKFSRILGDRVDDAMAFVDSLARLRGHQRGWRSKSPSAAVRDPKDAYLLDLAERTGSSLIVSGDKDLLVFEEHAGIPIVTPRVAVLITKSFL